MSLVPIPLVEVFDIGRFGGKAVSLAHAIRAKLPVPNGFGIEVELVDEITAGRACKTLSAAFASLGGAVAIRSSAVGEDDKDASFAGQHLSVMNLCSAEAVLEAVRRVGQSGHTEAALAYRRDHGLTDRPAVAAVMQKMVVPDVAGVLFTRDPVTGADERVVEAAWGLGEVIVAGLVVPDFFRIGRDGAVKERRAGVKDVILRAAANGDTEEIDVDDERANRLCLEDAFLMQLNELAKTCEQYYRGGYELGLDIEWAIEEYHLFLLQCRPITRT